MESYLKACPACGQLTRINGQQGKCPACNSIVKGDPPAVMPVAAPEPALLSPDPVFTPPPRPSGPSFPERMKANKALAGRVCASCGQPVELGNDVWNCQTCQSTLHQACRESAGCCLTPGCPAGAKKPAAAAEAATLDATAPGVAMVPCKFCGEKILPKARKCRHCGEFQSEIDRSNQNKRNTALATEDENLSAGEIAFGILCGGIACIMSIIWILQGKKKGWKLLALAVASAMFWSFVQVLGKH